MIRFLAYINILFVVCIKTTNIVSWFYSQKTPKLN
nr:MAG TPA: hypothetical protein [Bacteriophage sp.]